MKSNDFLQELHKERSNDAKVINKYAGIRKTFTDFYPDKAHFIYELMQNAEDANATEVVFSLSTEKLVVEHDGAPFLEKDVRSITDIGDSSKVDSDTSIGKFGVGFKAVFIYTNTPLVYSDKFAFKIYDLIVPEQIPSLNQKTNKTVFELPFNNPNKLPELAVADIEKGITDFRDNTLLFLSHIRKIDYALPDGSQGSLERIDHENGRIEIHAKHPHHDETVSHWLHFHKDVAVADSDEKEKMCRVAIAYRLEKVIDKNKESETWKIAPTHGQVSIYFPAEKETSELKFHIHAPFASTVARDSVRDTPENELLRNHIADLVVESLSAIKEQGLLTMSFLAVLPNPKNEQLSSFYEPIRRKIVKAFKENSFTPTKSGDYYSSLFCYRGLAKISNVIDDKDLSTLSGNRIKHWVANPSQLNSREDNFLDSLGIEKWNFEQLLTAFHDLPFSSVAYGSDYQKWMDDNKIRRLKIESWFEQKSDKWLMLFYALLDDATNKRDWESLNFPLVRVSSEDGVKHVVGKEAYFESLHGHISAVGINIVKREVYTKDNIKRDIDENAENFLESIGVRSFDETAAIKLLIETRYRKHPNLDSYDYYSDIKQIINYWKEHIHTRLWGALWKSSEIIEVENLLKSENFLLGTKKLEDGKTTSCWLKASDICLDDSYFETGLSKLTHIHQKFPIWYNYKNKLSEEELKDFVDFLKAFGVMYKLDIVESDPNKNINNPYRNQNYNGQGRDYTIRDLTKYIETKTAVASRLIWQAVINARADVKSASFKPNRKPEKIFDSSLLTQLKNNTWILGKDGYLRTPRSMTHDNLPDDFIFNKGNGLLTALDFGKNAKDQEELDRKKQEQQTTEFKQRDMFAKESGFESVEEQEKVARLLKKLKEKGISLEDAEDKLLPQTPDFSENVSANPNRRAEKVKEEAENAPEKRKVLSLRSVSDGEFKKVKQEAKEYLRDNYTFDDVLHCQICQKEMPFKLADGSYYFEAVSLLGDVSKVHKYNHIALCPLDSAKFQHANKSKDEIVNLIKELIDDRTVEEINDSFDDEISISLELAGKMETLTFTPKHLVDIKATLEA